MKLAPAPSSPRNADVHWTVRMNRRNRSVFYMLLFAAVGSHLLVIGAPRWAWGALALNYLAFPQIAYWLARRATDQRQAEMRNMDADVVFAGIWMGALGFPLWITFVFCASGCINLVVFRGVSGGPRLLVMLGAGVALAALAVPISWHPDTDLRTTLLCMLALGLYLFAFARDGYDRAVEQHKAHVQLREHYEEIRSLQARLSEQALRDPLTGLFNRRQLDAQLAPMLQQCRAHGTPLAIVLIDLDHFKRINDAHGHAAGDTVLQALAQLLLRHVRPSDLACRLGGEEFLLVLDNTTLTTATERAETVRQAFEVLRVRAANHDLSATLSCGVAAFTGDESRPEALLARADQALYAAKEGGRNRVVVDGGTQAADLAPAA